MSANRPQRNTPSNLDRLPPHSPEAEQGVLGCVLLSPNECLPECIERIGRNEDFYDLRHQIIYCVLLEMYDARVAIDVITLQQWLKDRNLLQQVGGIAYLAGLPDAVPSAANLSYYLDIVCEKALLRRLIYLCTDTVGRVYEHTGEVREVIERHEQSVLGLLIRQVSRCIPIKEAVRLAITLIEKFHTQQGPAGIPTGFPDLDRVTCGLQAPDMIVLAGRPSAGKTAMAMNLAEHVAIDQKMPVGVFSMEMSTEALVLRMLCSRARVDMQKLREGRLDDGDIRKLTVASVFIANAPLFIDDTPGLSLTQLRGKARRMAQLYGIKLFVIDYLQLMNAIGRRVENRQQEITLISSGIKALAKELNVPIIVLSQLNREMEKGGRKNKPRKPRLSDLRESGSIEQDADLVGLLWYPDEELKTLVELVIAKQRNGPTDDVQFTFLKQYTRFESVARNYEQGELV